MRTFASPVISSVLGNCGMRGQTDYTFANAWLDEAVRQIQSAHPGIQCLSLGYSVWADTGLGKRLGSDGRYVRAIAWGMTAALTGTIASNFFYLTMTFYYFYAFIALAVALPVVFAKRGSAGHA